MSLSTLTSKGQTTIPKEVRDLLKLKTGDVIDFVVRGENEVILKPISTPLADLKGFLSRKGQHVVSVEEMNAAVRKKFSRQS